MSGWVTRVQDVQIPGAEDLSPIVVENRIVPSPELIDLLTPADPGLLTQPVATLIAAVLALCAAGIAWWNMNRQIEASRNGQARSDRLEALADATMALHKFEKAATETFYTLMLKTDPDGDTDRLLTVFEQSDTCRSIAARLDLLSMSDAADAVRELAAMAEAAVLPTSDSMGQKLIGEMSRKVRSTIELFYRELDMPSGFRTRSRDHVKVTVKPIFPAGPRPESEAKANPDVDAKPEAAT